MADKTLLLKNANLLCTMEPHDEGDGRSKAHVGRPGDHCGAEVKNGGLFARNGIIEAVGDTDSLPADADMVIDMTGHVVIPGMVNTHHHMFQNLTRAVPAAQNAPLFGWLQTLYPIWRNLGPDHIYWSNALAMAELALSGCTTSSDHLYLYPNGARLDDSFAAAAEIGMRFHGTRGSMSIGESKGGLPPDCLTEAEPAILADCQRLIETHHNADRYAMHRVALAPCSPFSVSMDLMRETAHMARAYQVACIRIWPKIVKILTIVLPVLACVRANISKLSNGLAMMSGMRIVCSLTHGKLTCLPAPEPALPIAPVQICAYQAASRQFVK